MNGDLPNLTVHQLRYVREAAAGPTWTDAAARLGVSQSALSQGVAEVERRLGAALFERRSGRGPNPLPTAALHALLPVAEAVVASIGDLDRRLHELDTGTVGELRLGMIDTAALGAAGSAIERFRAAHPRVVVSLVVEPSSALVHRVVAGAVDLAVVVAGDELRPELSARPLDDEPVHVYAPTAAAARRPAAEWGPWAMYPAGSRTRALIESALAARGAPVRVVAESSNPDVLRQLVRLGVGWCALPRDVAEAPGTGGGGGTATLHRVPGPPLTRRTLTLIRRRSALPNGAADAYVSELARGGRRG